MSQSMPVSYTHLRLVADDVVEIKKVSDATLVGRAPDLSLIHILDVYKRQLRIIAFIQCWMWYGNTMIVLCAGILGINPSLYEAASVDGATSKQQFFKITLPRLKPILQLSLIHI